MSVHPLFADILKSIGGTMDRIPERPLQPPHNHDVPQLSFDEYDDDLMHDILGNDRLAKPVQALLISLNQIEMVQASFGDPDKARILEQLLPELKALRMACIEEFRDL